MTEFEKVLEECLQDLEEGASSVDECLSRHPRHADQLRPILLASVYLGRARAVPASEEFKARVRARVMREVQAYPRKSMRSASLLMRLSIGLAAVLLALLATGTAYAQGTLPGDAFYAWKLASENAWRAVSSDPIGIDLKIAARRADELIAVSKNPSLYPRALKTYLETATRLRSEANVENAARILPLLDSQVKKLSQSGIILPQPGKDVPPASQRTPIPVITATPLPASPVPQPDSTQLLQSTSTVQAPAETEIAPTPQVPPKIVPTLHSPPSVSTIEIPPPVR